MSLRLSIAEVEQRLRHARCPEPAIELHLTRLRQVRRIRRRQLLRRRVGNRQELWVYVDGVPSYRCSRVRRDLVK